MVLQGVSADRFKFEFDQKCHYELPCTVERSSRSSHASNPSLRARPESAQLDPNREQRRQTRASSSMGKRRRQTVARRGARGKPSALSALPPDLMACVARAALAAEGSTVRARCRLSLVSRAWGDSLRGA